MMLRGMLANLRRSPSGMTRLAAMGTVLLAAGCLANPLPAGPAPEASCRRVDETSAASGARIDWRLPPDPGDLERLSRWCAAVGPAIAHIHPADEAGGADQPEGLDSLAVISWNTHVGGGDLARLVGDLRAGRLTNGRPVRDFVLLLQEVYRADVALPRAVAGTVIPSRVEEDPPAGIRHDIVQDAHELGLSVYYVPSMRNGSDLPGEEAEDRGNAILSSLQLHDLRAIELPFEAQRRVAVSAAVRVGNEGGGELRLTSVHLDTRSTGSRVLNSLGAGRLRQAEGLVGTLADQPAAVLAGDLNSWSLEALESAILFLRERFPQTPTVRERPTFSTGWGYARRLDHMFFRLPEGWRATYDRIDERYGSDHHPLLAWVVPAGAGSASPRSPLPRQLAEGGR